VFIQLGGIAALQIIVNGKTKELEEETLLADLVNELGYAESSVAVVIDGRLWPRSKWNQKLLVDGQCLEFVSPMQGG
jgi:thiamine biosynthesis protein ThiS